MTFIETNRLLLRNITPEDADIMYDYRNNEICARYQRGQTRDYEGILALTERRKNDKLSVEAPFMVAVALKDSDEMVGEIAVMPDNGTISLGYTISWRHHRKGYAFEALTALINLLHERYPEWDFICFTEPENEPSMALLKKLGYKDMGYVPLQKSRVFLPDENQIRIGDQRCDYCLRWMQKIMILTERSFHVPLPGGLSSGTEKLPWCIV